MVLMRMFCQLDIASILIVSLLYAWRAKLRFGS